MFGSFRRFRNTGARSSSGGRADFFDCGVLSASRVDAAMIPSTRIVQSLCFSCSIIESFLTKVVLGADVTAGCDLRVVAAAGFTWDLGGDRKALEACVGS